MKRLIPIITLCIIGLGSSYMPVQAEWGLNASPDLCFVSYKETLPSHLKSEESGVIPGFGLQLTMKSSDSIWTSDLQILSGDMNYDGTTQVGRPVTLSKHNDFLHIETAVQSGISKVGLGSDIWNRDLIDYHETYTRSYALLGVSLPIQQTGVIDASLNITATLPFQSKMALGFNSSSSSMDFTLENKMGWKVAVPVAIVSGKTPISITPYAEWYEFGASQVAQVKINSQTLNLQEPSSQTFKAGIAMLVSF